jgi:hypothetical protein
MTSRAVAVKTALLQELTIAAEGLKRGKGRAGVGWKIQRFAAPVSIIGMGASVDNPVHDEGLLVPGENDSE